MTLKDALEALREEKRWSEENIEIIDILDLKYKQGFIAGITQAIDIIEELESFEDD